jgi:hypothetical protein
MDGSGFDRWTRRRFGLATGGFAAAIALFGPVDAEAGKNRRRRRRRKKRCKNFGDPCQQGGKRKCCGDLRCDFHNNGNQTVCCKTTGKPCSDELDCCVGLTCCGLTEPTCEPIPACV